MNRLLLVAAFLFGLVILFFVCAKPEIESAYTIVQQAKAPANAVETQLQPKANTPKVAALNCQKEFDELLANEMILFQTDTAVIEADSAVLLQALSFAAEKCPDAYITVSGHTDNLGDDQYNQKLSEKRARAVAYYLMTMRIDENRLLAVGYGETQPIGDNDTEDGRKLNRRIEFTVGGL